MATQNSVLEEPEFISFLFSSKLNADSVFLVGNKNHMKPERIGVVKAMLMAHSGVLRLELEDSELADKGEVSVPDIYPDTFRMLLRYVYGHDTTAALCFDEADNLLYVAEKYMMGTLKKKLATRLMSLLNTENICSLLNNPACYTQLELNSAITEILRYETNRVLASPLFLGLNPDGFVKILEQDGLNVPEIELWRAMMKWGKHNANSEDGKAVRKQVSKLTKHIRVCSLDYAQFCQEVVPTDVLTDKEVVLVCKSVGKQEQQTGLTSICNQIKPRVLLQKKPNVSQSEKKQFQLEFINHEVSREHVQQEFNFTVFTKKCDIELLPLECSAQTNYYSWNGNYKVVSCTTTITRITDHQSDTSTETPVTVRFNQRVQCRTLFMIPLTSGGHNVTLLANNRYTFRMVFAGDVNVGVYVDRHHNTPVYDNNHLSLRFENNRVQTGIHSWCRGRGGRGLDLVGFDQVMALGNAMSMVYFDHFIPMSGLKYKATDA